MAAAYRSTPGACMIASRLSTCPSGPVRGRTSWGTAVGARLVDRVAVTDQVSQGVGKQPAGALRQPGVHGRNHVRVVTVRTEHSAVDEGLAHVRDRASLGGTLLLGRPGEQTQSLTDLDVLQCEVTGRGRQVMRRHARQAQLAIALGR